MKKIQKQTIDVNNFTELKERVTEEYINYRSDLSNRRPIDKLASYFAIKVDASRLEDYYVRSFDEEYMSICIVDKKTDTVYFSRFTFHTKLIDYLLTSGLYLEAFSYEGNSQTQTLYRVQESDKLKFMPLINELIITHGDRALSFLNYYNEKTEEIDGSCPFVVSLEESLTTYDDISKRKLLHAKMLTSPSCKTKGGLREETMVAPGELSIWQRINANNPQTLFYSIDRSTETSHVYGYMRNIDRVVLIQNRWKMRLVHLVEPSTKDHLYTNTIDIYKRDCTLSVNSQVCAVPFYFELADTTDGPLTIAEINEVIKILNSTFPQQDFIQTVIFELTEFARRLSLHQGLEVEDEDYLTPELFANLSNEQIKNVITEELDAYFEKAEIEYETSLYHLTGRKRPSTYKIKPED